MAAPLKTQSRISNILDGLSKNLAIKNTLASNAFEYLLAYDFQGTGLMPNHSWTSPDGAEFSFSNSNSEILLNATAYSSLSAEEKRQFFKWINHFIRECVIRYENTYGV